jgi:hypothetical protein
MQPPEQTKEEAAESCPPDGLRGRFSPLSPLPPRPRLVCGWLAAILGVAFAGVPAVAPTASSDQKPLGAISETAGAHLNGVSALSGASVYSGDVVETDARGALHLRLGSGQIFLSASSSASLERRGRTASVTLVKGAATFSLPDPLQFELQTPAGTLRGSGTRATGGQVVVFSPRQIVVTASRGDLVLDNDGEFYTIRQGQSYRIVVQQDSLAPDSAAYVAKHVRRRKLFFFLLAGDATVAAAIPLRNFAAGAYRSN